MVARSVRREDNQGAALIMQRVAEVTLDEGVFQMDFIHIECVG